MRRARTIDACANVYMQPIKRISSSVQDQWAPLGCYAMTFTRGCATLVNGDAFFCCTIAAARSSASRPMHKQHCQKAHHVACSYVPKVRLFEMVAKWWLEYDHAVFRSIMFK